MIDLTPEASPARRAPALAVFAALLAAAAFLTPLWAAEPERAAGLLLIVGVGAELLQSFRRRTAAAQRSAQASAGYTLLLAIVLLSTAWLAVTALAIFLAAPFALDALRGVSIAARRLFERRSFGAEIGGVLANLAAVVVILVLGRFAEHWIVGVAAGIRLLTIAGNVASAPIHDAGETDEGVIADIGLPDPDRLADTGARLQKEELERGGADRGWILSLVTVLFAIHVSRMGFDRSALGIMSPLIAVMGDVAVALALTYFVIVPFRLFVRRVTRGVERTAWERLFHAPARTGIKAWPGIALRWWLESRLRFAIRLRAARYSLRIGVRPRPADRAAAHRRHRRLGPHLGHELVLRHGELGGRSVELVGGVPDRHVALRDDPRRGCRRGNDAGRQGVHSDAAWLERQRPLLLHRHRGHR